MQTAEGKLYLFVPIDRTSKFAFTQLVEQATRVTASAFLTALIAAVPYKIHTILTDNGIQFRFAPRYGDGPTARYMTHMFDMRCREHRIEHRFTKINHPWTNGQVERMNRTIKQATVQRYHYDDHDQLRGHLDNFVSAYNFGRRLKTLKGLTPYEFVCKAWQTEPLRFTLNPLHQMPGLNRIVPTQPKPGCDRLHALRPVGSKQAANVKRSPSPPRAAPHDVQERSQPAIEILSKRQRPGHSTCSAESKSDTQPSRVRTSAKVVLDSGQQPPAPSCYFCLHTAPTSTRSSRSSPSSRRSCASTTRGPFKPLAARSAPCSNVSPQVSANDTSTTQATSQLEPRIL